MSVAAIPSPVHRKRLFESESLDNSSFERATKRTRAQRSPSRYQPNALAALLVLFPSMDERVVQEVLVECNHSIDAAIKRLTDLRLSTEDATVAAATAAATPASVPSSVDAGLNGAPSTQQPAQAAAEPAGPVPAVPGDPQTADQWIDYLVSEMSASRDMADARSRAAVVLQHFERFIKQRQKSEGDARIAELLKENAIFKRAIQIQASRMQAKNGLEEEVASLRNALSQYQEQCRRLELHNYSLAMHLQQATSSSTTGGHFSHHPPDVF